MVSTFQSYIYEDLHPKIETQDTPEAHLLIVYIPDGFTKGDVGAKVEYDFGRVRVFGERSIESNKMARFNEKYQVPSHCDIGKIRGNFDGKTITITMPNIPGKVPPQQKQKPIEDNNAAKVNDQKDQQNTSHQDPKSNVESKEDTTPQDEQKVTTPQKGYEEISQKDQATKDDENPISQDATKESIAQKDPNEISQKDYVSQKRREQISKNESISQKDQEEISQKEHVSQKGREEISQKESIHEKGQQEISSDSQVTKIENKEKPHHETPTPSEGTHRSIPQKSKNQGTPDKTAHTKDAKLQTHEATSSLKDENKENQKFVKEETKDHHKKTMESEKSHVVNDSSPTLEKETKPESKESAKVDIFPPKKTFIEKGKKMINEKLGNDNNDEKKSFHESTRSRIKDMALSTTQAVTNYAKRFNEEDKQKLIYTGATILVVALGVYASYKYRSSRRT